MHIDLGSERSIDMSYTGSADLYLGDVSSQVAEYLYRPRPCVFLNAQGVDRSEEHTSELQSLMRISYAVFCLKKKKQNTKHNNTTQNVNTARIKKENEISNT